ncbi:MAG: hypothetical protein OXH10_02600 [bacterium]|nr:hypothetical protein [bacterium]
MQDSIGIRLDRATHQALRQIASELGITVGETLALMVRRFRQDRMREELATPLTSGEVEWLNADFG